MDKNQEVAIHFSAMNRYVKILLLLLSGYPFLSGGSGILQSVLAMCILACVVLLMLGIVCMQSREIRITVADLLMFVLVVWGMVRTPWMGWMNGAISGVEWLGMLGLYIVVRFTGWNQGVWYGLALAGLILAFTGGRYFPNPGPYGGYLALAWIACGGIFLTTRKVGWGWRTLWFGCASLILVWALVRSDSRSAWIAALAGYGWLGISCFARGQERICAFVLRYRWVTFPIAAILLAGAGVLLYLYKSGSVHGRLLIWRVAGQMFAESPWIGRGWGTFGREYMYAQADLFREFPSVGDGLYAGDNWQAFNEGLHLLCELGVVGGVLAAGLLVLLFRRRLNGSVAQAVGFGLLVFSCFSYPASVPALEIYFMLLAAAMVNDMGFRPLFCRQLKPFCRWTIGFVLLVFGIGVIYLQGVVRQAEKTLEQAVQDKEKLPEALAFFPQMRGEADYVLCLGKQLYKNRDYRNALKVLDQAARLRPTTEILCDLGDCYWQLKEYNQAEACFLLARDMIPVRITARYLLFCLYQETGQEQKTTAMAREILQTRVKVVNSRTLDAKREARRFLMNDER